MLTGPYVPYILYAIIAASIFTAYMALVNIFRRDRMRQRMNTVTNDYMMAESEEKPSGLASFCKRVLSLLKVDVTQQKELSLQLSQAGIQSPHAVAYFLFSKRVLQPVALALGVLLFLEMLLSAHMTGTAKLFYLLMALLFMGFGLFGTSVYMANRKQRRQATLLHSFPDALDLLLVCIESGLGLDAALSRVCAEMQVTHPVIAGELDRTRVELTMLAERTQALQNLADRTEIIPFKALVSSLIQTEKFGTSLVDTLRVLSEDQRTTRLFTAEQRAARLPVLITVPLIICTLPALMMVILGPPIVRIVNQGGIFGHATPHK